MLRSIGVGVAPPGADLAKATCDDIVIIRDSEQAGMVGAFALSLICRRCMTLAWHSRGLPGLFAGLMDPERGQSVLDKIRALHGYWSEVSTFTGAFWERMQERSRFRLVFVQQVVLLAQASQWKLTRRS